MQIQIECEVVFYDPEHIGINFSWSGENQSNNIDVRKKYDSFLFGCFLLRQLRNNGAHPGFLGLENVLSSANSEISGGKHLTFPLGLPCHGIYFSALSMGMDENQAKRTYGAPIYVVAYHGSNGKRFIGRLTLRPDRLPMFILDVKGFGFGLLAGKDMPQYSLDSVICLYAYLQNVYKDDKDYFNNLFSIAKAIHVDYMLKRVTIMNQEVVAMEAVSKHLGV